MFRELASFAVAAALLVHGGDALAAKPAKKKKPKTTAPATAPATVTSEPMPPPPPPAAETPTSSSPSTSTPSRAAEASGAASASASASSSTDTDATSDASEHAAAANEPRGESAVLTGVSAALLAGYGFGSSPNYYGLGFGARAGYTFPMHLYVGGTFMYHGGSSSTVFGLDVAHHLLYPGVEAGYDLGVGPVIVRPYAGLGIAWQFATTGNQSASANNVAFWPGVTGLYPIKNFVVGADARFVVSSGANALTLAATGGMYF